MFKREILIIYLLICPSILFAEVLNFSCKYKYTLENFPPSKETSSWGSNVSPSKNKNLCEQLKKEASYSNPSAYSKIDTLQFCLRDGEVDLSVDIDKEQFSIRKGGGSWVKYPRNYSNKNRVCSSVDGDLSLCTYNANNVSLEQDELELRHRVVYQLGWCPIDLPSEQFNNYYTEEQRDQHLKYCLGIASLNLSAMTGRYISYTIDRNTLEFEQEIMHQTVSLVDDKFIHNQTRGSSHSAFGTTFHYFAVPDEGTCELNRRQF